MNNLKEAAFEEFKTSVMYIGAFVNGPLPKTDKIRSQELPNKNPEGENHITLFYLGEYEDISEELFDDIINLPDRFIAYINGYGFDGKNQGVSVNARDFDFSDIHSYGDVKATPHITYSWDEKNGGAPVGTGFLDFVADSELNGTAIDVVVKAYLCSGETVPIQYFRDRSKGLIPYLSPKIYEHFSDHNQNTPYHCSDLREHTIKVAEYIIHNASLAGIRDDLVYPLIVAAQWHDVGKLYTRGVDERGFNTYLGHLMKSAELFENTYSGENKERILFLIANHDAFLFYGLNDLTTDRIKQLMQAIQRDTSFSITTDDWRALGLLMEADESAKEPIVIIDGKTVRTKEEDLKKVAYVTKKMIALSETELMH